MAKRRFYIVRLRADDRILAVGTGPECAAQMGMSLETFRATVSRCTRGLSQKYEIDVELEEDEPC